jgi:putative redox protein
MEMSITFPGGVAVNAEFHGFTVATDQPATQGGGGTAPSPFDLFLASIGTCAGFYALRFCQQRGLETLGLAVTLATEKNPDGHGIAAIRLALELPPGFPDKYREAILRAVDQCTVKHHILQPPRFEITAVAAGVAARGR